MADIPSWIVDRLSRYGKRPCLMDGEGRTHSFADLLEEVARNQAALSGHPAGTVVLASDFTLGGIASLIACSLSSWVVAPTLEKEEEAHQRLAALCGATHVASGSLELGLQALDEKYAQPTPELIQRLRQAHQPGLVLVSSGITGKPKAMVHNLSRLLDTYQDRRQRSLPIALFLLFDHIGGLNTLFGSLASGMPMLALPSRDPETVCRLLEKHQVTILPATPTFLNLVVAGGYHRQFDLSGLKLITYGAESMPESLLRRVREAFPEARLIETFGTSETGIAKTVQSGSDRSFFRPEDPAQEFRIVEGELWIRSQTQVLGYLNQSNEAFSEEGWFRTGDLAESLEDGSIRILSRKNDLINIGGEKAYPAEIESVVLELKEVSSCKVYGVSHALTGQAVAVDIVLGQGLAIEPSEMRSRLRMHCRERLARHKVPTQIRIVDGLTITARFKSKPAEKTDQMPQEPSAEPL